MGRVVPVDRTRHYGLGKNVIGAPRTAVPSAVGVAQLGKRVGDCGQVAQEPADRVRGPCRIGDAVAVEFQDPCGGPNKLGKIVFGLRALPMILENPLGDGLDELLRCSDREFGTIHPATT